MTNVERFEGGRMSLEGSLIDAEQYRADASPFEHEGTKYEHSTVNASVDLRCPFNYCSLCNGWFPRK